jgi:hypothetical protein
MFSQINNFWKFIYFLAVIPVYCIIGTVLYTFTNYYLLDGREFTYYKTIMSLVFYFLAFMTILCHTLSMITSPGFVDQKYFQTFEKEQSEATTNIGTFCKKCDKSRPERAHHCSTCKKCVLKMDHHCPWIFNCVGFANQKFFYLFLFYASLGDLIACICLTTKILEPSFFEMIIRPKRRINLDGGYYLIFEILKSMKDPLLIILGTTLSFTMAIAIGILFFYQTYLIMNNLTSIENSTYSKKEHSPFFSENKILNIKSVLGLSFGILWFMPTFRPNKYNKGVSYVIVNKNHCANLKDECKEKSCN